MLRTYQLLSVSVSFELRDVIVVFRTFLVCLELHIYFYLFFFSLVKKIFMLKCIKHVFVVIQCVLMTVSA